MLPDSAVNACEVHGEVMAESCEVNDTYKQALQKSTQIAHAQEIGMQVNSSAQPQKVASLLGQVAESEGRLDIAGESVSVQVRDISERERPHDKEVRRDESNQQLSKPSSGVLVRTNTAPATYMQRAKSAFDKMTSRFRDNDVITSEFLEVFLTGSGFSESFYTDLMLELKEAESSTVVVPNEGVITRGRRLVSSLW